MPRPQRHAGRRWRPSRKRRLTARGLRSDVVTLYRGGRYHLYSYKKYTDVRLVFAPESAIASFGGDPDNFEFPRYDLDCAFFRVYEDGKPAKPAHFLNWGESGTKEGDLVFVAGNPVRLRGSTRWPIWSTCATWRCRWRLAVIEDEEEGLLQYGRRGPEALRQSKPGAARCSEQAEGLRRPTRGAARIRASSRERCKRSEHFANASRRIQAGESSTASVGQDRPLAGFRAADRSAAHLPGAWRRL